MARTERIGRRGCAGGHNYRGTSARRGRRNSGLIRGTSLTGGTGGTGGTGIIGGTSLTGGAGLAAAPAAPSAVAPMTGQQVIQILDQTIDWYRTLGIQQQAASEPSDLLILYDNRQTANQVISLAFELARANAEILAKQPQPKDSGACTIADSAAKQIRGASHPGPSRIGRSPCAACEGTSCAEA